METTAAALDGLRVLEVSARTSAAFAGRLFADSGASVTVARVPTDIPTSEHLGMYLDRGKQGVEFDVSAGKASAEIARIAQEHDLLVTDLDPREIERLGLNSVSGGRLRARLLITPFGMSGPYRDRPATPATILALSGHTFLLGEPGQAPLTLPGDYVGYQSALYGYSAALAALLEARRARRTEPRTVEVSELEALASLHQHTTVNYTYSGHIRVRKGNRWDGIHPITILPCADGWFGMCIVATFWENFAKWLGPQWLSDPRFSLAPERIEHASELDEEIKTAIAPHTKVALQEEGQGRRRVPVGAVRTPAEILVDPQLIEREFWGSEVTGGRPVLFPTRPFRFVGEVEARAGTSAPAEGRS
ncbi:MAG: hypothetical protein EPO65_09075 [Dehalococcoidia bacterium]|nr:MAG: hypothetical protein EPO65_09075 [Dehalococcoidia bacterium]